MNKMLFVSALFVFALGRAEEIAPAPYCVPVEGVPVPKCLFPQYHECKLPPVAYCKYIKLQIKVRTVADPKVGKCPQGAQTCTDIESCVPSGCTTNCESCSTTRSCTCNEPIPNITECRKVCATCRPPGSNVEIDLQVKCAAPTCTPPPSCITPITIDGEEYHFTNTGSIPDCNTPDNCVGEPSNDPPPTCKLPTMPWGQCCYYGPEEPRVYPQYTGGLARCP